ncbi:MAG: SUMF1/EgtB/PvdO family nonheme iron enzyme [Terricaulis sp.]
MADVFLSYRNTVERRAFVKRLALLLRAHEISVWWDYGLEAGESYRAQITDELSRARLVAPLWCAESIVSKWVAMEAELGKDKLVPARLQKVVPPEAFEAIQAADLIGWDGSVQHPRVLAYVGKICERLGKPSRAPIDMMEELSELRALAPLPEIASQSLAAAASAGLDFVLADLRATWTAFANRDDSGAAERFLARVRGTAPGSGLEFEIEEHLEALRAEAGRREAAQRASAEAARREAEAKAARGAEETRRRTPGAEFRDGEGLPLLVTIQPGKFTMGSPPNEKDRFDDEGPQREVRIEYPLAVGKFPVTVGEWKKFIAATGHDTGSSAYIWDGKEWKDTPGRGWASPGFPHDDGHPVTCVNWNDSEAFTAWIAKLTGQNYRLLSEAEWEYACRAGTTSRYACGDQITSAQANFNQDKGGTTPVGAYPANKFGLHDMHGNVWEWVRDFYAGSYAGLPSDGSANETKSSNRVYRGGSWYDGPQGLRSAKRVRSAPMGRVNDLGFRLARTI